MDNRCYVAASRGWTVGYWVADKLPLVGCKHRWKVDHEPKETFQLWIDLLPLAGLHAETHSTA